MFPKEKSRLEYIKYRNAKKKAGEKDFARLVWRKTGLAKLKSILVY